MKKKILVTGGGGYIGTHTIVDLIKNGYEVINLDNFSRSLPQMMERVEQITGQPVKTYKVDLCNFDDTYAVFQEHSDISGIIHFAAFKAVGESVEKPLLYFENNLFSLVNLLKCVAEFNIPHFVFSSSCTVYGNPDHIPVTEETIPKPAESPYGYTKQMGEQIVSETIKSLQTSAILLRYFNPVGAHPSGLIGELPVGRPQNLVPAITQTAIGKLPMMTVHGNDYDTRDGSCIRDYIHVSDLAHAHTLAISYLEQKKNFSPCEVFNLGTGNGYTVLEAIQTFEKVSGTALPYQIGPRRSGDVVAIYANNDKARDYLGWKAVYSLEDMMHTAWQWEQNLKKDETFFSGKQPELN
jgi:UDP-glucose 4-epimerase